jgi:hypothetical protein
MGVAIAVQIGFNRVTFPIRRGKHLIGNQAIANSRLGSINFPIRRGKHLIGNLQLLSMANATAFPIRRGKHLIGNLVVKPRSI